MLWWRARFERAVVAKVYDSESRRDCVLAVYLDNKEKPVAEDFRWAGEGWDFVMSGPGGAYADNSPRFRRYVAMLRGEKVGRGRRRR
jgi:hypothetical protein